MGYYSRLDPIHNNDIINNGHDTTAPAAFKKHLMELLFGIITPRPVPSYSAGKEQAKRKSVLEKEERGRKERKMENIIFLEACYQPPVMSQFAQ